MQHFQAHLQKEKWSGLENLKRGSGNSNTPAVNPHIHLSTLSRKVCTKTRQTKKQCKWEYIVFLLFISSIFIFVDRSAKEKSLKGRQAQTHLYSLLFRPCELEERQHTQCFFCSPWGSASHYPFIRLWQNLLFPPPTAVCADVHVSLNNLQTILIFFLGTQRCFNPQFQKRSYGCHTCFIWILAYPFFWFTGKHTWKIIIHFRI